MGEKRCKTSNVDDVQQAKFLTSGWGGMVWKVSSERRRRIGGGEEEPEKGVVESGAEVGTSEGNGVETGE